METAANGNHGAAGSDAAPLDWGAVWGSVRFRVSGAACRRVGP